jgi:DNA methylase
VSGRGEDCVDRLVRVSEATPELADLLKHERVIERGLATFVEVGLTLLAIRDGKKYRAAGHATFEHYCQARWRWSDSRARQMMSAARTALAIETDTGVTVPTEAAVRRLNQLPEAERVEAYAEAVELAAGDVPAPAVVTSVVERRVAQRRPQSDEHPAAYPEAVMTAIVELLEPLGVHRILDPFAGTGLGHDVADRLGADSVGVEIQPKWAAFHDRTICADARTITRKMVGRFDAMATSPTFGNRMADHHEARDGSDRPTYTHRHGSPLEAGNSGVLQWGPEYRDFHLAVWRKVVGLLEPGGAFVLDIKDHIREGRRMPVSAWHLNALLGLGLTYVDDNPVVTSGLGNTGANAKARVRVEHVYLFTKPLPGAS